MAAFSIAQWRAGGLLLFLLGLLGGGCEVLGFPEWHWRQKLTVGVASPTGPRSASSVLAVQCGSSPKWVPGAGAGGLGCQVQGEAVALELAPGQVLFALLTPAPGATNYPDKVAYHVFFPDRTLTTVEERGEQLERHIRGEVRELPRQQYPLLVTFTDLTDPTTVKVVDPENLAATFGPGVSLKRLTLEITDEPVTEGKIESVLGWWCDLRKKRARLNGSTSIAISDNELSNNLGTGSFRIGDCT